jgi:apolipoprotein N-acyltransferase
MRISILVSVVQAAVGFGLLVHWVSVVAPVAWPALVAIMVVWRIGLGLILRVLLQRHFAMLTIPAAWIVCEWIQTHVPWGGFPWGRLAYIGGLGWLTRGAVWWGTDGLAALCVALGVALWRITQRAQWSVARLAVCAIVVVGSAAAAPLAEPSSRSIHDGRSHIRVAVVQGSVPRQNFGSVEQEREVFQRHLNATASALGRHKGVDLVVWPENSVGDAVISDARLMSEVQSLVMTHRIALLSGTVLFDASRPSKLRNRSMLWDASGSVVDSYDKQHLVPFGEFVPLRSLARKVSSQVDLVSRDFAPGARPGKMRLASGAPFGVLMCFEVGYPDLARDLGDIGFLVNQTNNATYLRSGQPAQQFRMSQIRAAESGRYTVVAATSGVSGVIDGYGGVVAGTRVDINRAHVSVVDVPLVRGRTPAIILAPILSVLSALVTLLALSPWWPRLRIRQRRSVVGLKPGVLT